MAQHVESYDVLVVGAGPAGLTTAAGLARSGVRVLVVERHPGTSVFPKASGVRPRTMEILRAWGVEPRVRAAALPVRVAQVQAPTLSSSSRREIGLGVPDPEWLAAISPSSFAFCPQDLLEPILLDVVRASGGHVRFEHELVDIQLHGNGVTARIRRRGSDTPSEIRARYLVGADGPRSTIRARLGIGVERLGTEGEHLATLFLADFDAVLPDPPVALYEVTAPGAEGLFVAAGKHRWVYDHARDPREDRTTQTSERLAQRIRAAAGTPTANVRVLGIFPWTMDAEVAHAFRAGPAFLVGDAAARTTPRGGTGMNTGIAAAHNLAWKLAWVLHGWADEALLDTYDAERRPIGAANALRSLEIHDELGAGDPQEREVAADFGVVYASSAITAADGTPRLSRATGRVTVPGGRAPHAWVDLAGRRTSTVELFEGRLTVLIGRNGTPWSAAADRLDRRGMPLTALRLGHDLPDPDRTLSRLYGIGEEGAVLVRPDGHVAWLATSGSPDAAAVLSRCVDRATGRDLAAAPALGAA